MGSGFSVSCLGVDLKVLYGNYVGLPGSVRKRCRETFHIAHSGSRNIDQVPCRGFPKMMEPF